jgi:hypothetical protein
MNTLDRIDTIMNTLDLIEVLEDHGEEYAEYIMIHGKRPCGNGDMLLDLMESGYLLNEFITEMLQSYDH